MHHIEGYDKKNYGERDTVAVLCPKHHCTLERWTRFIRPFGKEKRRAEAVAIRAALDRGDGHVFFGEPKCLTR